MEFIDDLFSLFWDISDFFYAAAEVAKDWVWPFSILQVPLLAIAEAFWDMLDPIADWYAWTGALNATIAGFLDSSGIIKLLTTWIDYAEAAYTWISNASKNILGVIGSWWLGVSDTVKSWIDDAKAYAKALVDAVALNLATLQKTWDDFWTLTWPVWTGKVDQVIIDLASFFTDVLPTLATWEGVQTLIEDTIKEWFPFYDDLVALWDSIKEFFTDPLEYLWAKATDWFLGAEV